MSKALYLSLALLNEQRTPIMTPPLHPILALYATHRRALLTLAHFTGITPLNLCWGLTHEPALR